MKELKAVDANGNLVNVYWTHINDHKDAYKFCTLQNPRVVHPGMSDEEVEAFKVFIPEQAIQMSELAGIQPSVEINITLNVNSLETEQLKHELNKLAVWSKEMFTRAITEVGDKNGN